MKSGENTKKKKGKECQCFMVLTFIQYAVQRIKPYQKLATQTKF